MSESQSLEPPACPVPGACSCPGGEAEMAKRLGQARDRIATTESAFKTSREIADGLARALRDVIAESPKWNEGEFSCGAAVRKDGIARQALLAYDAARKGDGGERA